jgi:hypothetical protein
LLNAASKGPSSTAYSRKRRLNAGVCPRLDPFRTLGVY